MAIVLKLEVETNAPLLHASRGLSARTLLVNPNSTTHAFRFVRSVRLDMKTKPGEQISKVPGNKGENVCTVQVAQMIFISCLCVSKTMF
jgi:hypothetical protein